MSTKKGKINLTLQFAENLISIPDQIISGLIKSTEDADTEEVIKIYLETLKNQFSELSILITQEYEKASRQVQVDVESLVKTASGVTLTKSVEAVTGNLKSISAKLGLNSIIKEVKKLILFILRLLKVPSWIIDILLIIDQILNALLGLDLPTKLPQVLSRMEQDYLAELREHTALKRELQISSDELENDEL